MAFLSRRWYLGSLARGGFFGREARVDDGATGALALAVALVEQPCAALPGVILRAAAAPAAEIEDAVVVPAVVTGPLRKLRGVGAATADKAVDRPVVVVE